MNIPEKSRLVAEFMGENISSDGNSIVVNSGINGIAAYQPFRYHLDWSDLMPVVERIESLGYGTSFKTYGMRINPIDAMYYNYIAKIVFNEDGYVIFSHTEQDEDSRVLITGTEIIDKKMAIFLVVAEFVKWLKENNQK